MNWLTEPRRAYLYRVALAVMAVLVAYGVIDADTAPLWMTIVVAVLGLGTTGLAAVNTSTKPRDE